ncbi:MAG: hypothetical protein MZV70_22290 [Desulfobacterales bacterium]|nr:hypothetical protein [Desulfobacterales bacterium]
MGRPPERRQGRGNRYTPGGIAHARLPLTSPRSPPLAASFIWGFTFLSIKVALGALPPMSLGLARLSPFAGVLLACLLAARGRLPRLARPDAPRMAASGPCGGDGVLLLREQRHPPDLRLRGQPHRRRPYRSSRSWRSAPSCARNCPPATGPGRP